MSRPGVDLLVVDDVLSNKCHWQTCLVSDLELFRFLPILLFIFLTKPSIMPRDMRFVH